MYKESHPSRNSFHYSQTSTGIIQNSNLDVQMTTFNTHDEIFKCHELQMPQIHSEVQNFEVVGIHHELPSESQVYLEFGSDMSMWAVKLLSNKLKIDFVVKLSTI